MDSNTIILIYSFWYFLHSILHINFQDKLGIHPQAITISSKGTVSTGNWKKKYLNYLPNFFVYGENFLSYFIDGNRNYPVFRTKFQQSILSNFQNTPTQLCIVVMINFRELIRKSHHVVEIHSHRKFETDKWTM